MNISSVVLRAQPARIPEIRDEIARRPGHEIHGEHEAGRLALTIEDSDTRSAADAYVALHDIPGVIAVSLIYQYSDDETATAEPAAETIAN
ncbi:MAG TPA: chaperone NapD [Rhodocyclaceae bacterium]